MSEQKQMSKDLQKFIEKFEPNKYKIMPAGIEVRGMTRIHDALQSARDVIEKFQLNLMVIHNAEMLGYGGFEVKVI